MASEAEDQLALVRKLKSQNEEMRDDLELLRKGGGGGTLPPMDTVDAKIAAAEARTDTKFAELRGDLSKFATKGTVWGAMGTALGIVLAVAALAANRFDAGVSVRGAVDASLSEQRARDTAQDRKLDQILARLPREQPTR